MSEARKEILRLLAEDRIRLQDAEELLAALRVGYPEEFEAATGRSGVAESREVPRTGRGSAGRRRTTESEGRGREGRAGPRTQFADGKRPEDVRLSPLEASPGSGEAVAGGPPQRGPVLGVTTPREPAATSAEIEQAPTESGPPHILRLTTSESLELPGDALLRIESSPDRARKEDTLTSVALRGLPTNRLTVVRGSGVEARQVGSEFVLTWPRGLLLLEIPNRLGTLEIRNLAGAVGISGYMGPFMVEELDGPLTVHGPASPFRVRNVRGLVRILGLALRDGISTIAQTEGDVEIEAADVASVSVRAVSTEGGVSLGDDPVSTAGATQRRRGVWRLGAGTAQLNVSSIQGRIWLRRSQGPGSGPSS